MDPSVFRSLSFLLEKAGSELEMLSSRLEDDLHKTYTVDGRSTSPMDVLKSVRKLQSRTSSVAEQAKTTANSKQSLLKEIEAKRTRIQTALTFLETRTRLVQ